MFTLKRLIGHSLVVFVLAGTALAQKNPAPNENPQNPGSAPLLTASATGERVRFVSPGTVVRLRLEVYDETGQKLFDSELHRGNVLDWHLQDGAGQRLPAGSYGCVVTIKSLSGRFSQRVGLVTVTDKKVAIEAGGLAQFSNAQQQAIGPIEENAVLTVGLDGDVPSATIVAHDEQDGQLTSTKGALTFRTGNVFAGEDKEHMRITEDGRVGIGTNKPESTLDVAGTVRVSNGVQFADGTTLDAAGGRLMTRDGSGTLVPSVAGTGTIDRLVKWAETDGDGALTNAAAAETGGLTIFGENAAGEVAPLFPTAPSSHVVEVGGTGSKTPLVLAGGSGVMEIWKDLGGGTGEPAAAVSIGMAKPGTASTNDMIFSNQLSGQPWTEQMRVTSDGHLGIGTTNPIFNDDGVTGANVGKWVAIDGGASGNSAYLGLGGTVPGVTDRVGLLNFYNWSMGGVDNRTATIGSYNDGELGQGNLLFSTAPNNVGPVERMRIGWHGGIGINMQGAANTGISLKGFTSDSTSYAQTFQQATGVPYFFARNDRKVFVATSDPNSILSPTINASFFVGQTGQFSVNSTGDVVQNSLTLKGATSGSVSLAASATGGELMVGPTTLTDGAGQVLSSALNTVDIEQGGTSQTTANAAFNALAPSQTSNSGNFLTSDGTNTSWASAIGISGSGTNNRIVKFTGNAGTLGDSAITEVNGKVGIGTTAPDYPLTVVRNYNGATGVLVFNTTDGASAQAAGGASRTIDFSSKYITYGVTAPSFSAAGYGETAYFHAAGVPLKFGTATANDLYFFTNGITNTRMTVSSAGNVGIGTNNPAAKLDVGGTVKIAAPLAGTGVALCRDLITGLIVNCSASSRRFKENIFGLRSGLEVVRRLRPVSFVWKENGQRDLGLVAEEVNRVEPLLALRNPAGEIEGVRYNRLSVVLVSAVQEQQQELQAKEARIAALEARLASLERAVNRRRRGQRAARR